MLFSMVFPELGPISSLTSRPPPRPLSKVEFSRVESVTLNNQIDSP